MGALKSGCERARAWVSLELDAELSELEHALLAAHLDRCAACAAFAHDVRGLAGALRAAPLELPREVPAPIRRRDASVRVLQALGAAAAVAVAIGLGSLVGTLSSQGPATPSAAAIAATQQPYLEQKLLALDARRAERQHGGEAVPF